MGGYLGPLKTTILLFTLWQKTSGGKVLKKILVSVQRSFAKPTIQENS